jgi:flagellum-specific peptidoglycan hydrolase FlgJ
MTRCLLFLFSTTALVQAQSSPTTDFFYSDAGGLSGFRSPRMSPQGGAVSPALAGDQRILAQKILATATPSQRPFLNFMIPAAAYLQKAYGIPFSATLAMSVYESGYGRSKLAAEHHNFFGIKAFDSSWSGEKTKMPTVDSGEKVMAWFRSYPSIRAGVLDYATMLSTSPRYAGAFSSSDGISFVATVLRGGYCPDADYLDNIRSIVARHQMELLDAPSLFPREGRKQVASIRP